MLGDLVKNDGKTSGAVLLRIDCETSNSTRSAHVQTPGAEAGPALALWTRMCAICNTNRCTLEYFYDRLRRPDLAWINFVVCLIY